MLPDLPVVTGLRSPSLQPRVTAPPNPEDLPFRLEAYLDRDDLGVEGIRTEPGAVALLRSWADSVASDRGESLGDCHPCRYLAEQAAWIEQRWPAEEWEVLASEVALLHDRVAQKIGFRAQHVGDCPRCGGELLRQWTKTGAATRARCRVCGQSWDAESGELARARLLMLEKSPADLYIPIGIVLDLAEAKGLTGVKASQVRLWVHRKTVATRKGPGGRNLYRLADVATHLARLLDIEVKG